MCFQNTGVKPQKYLENTTASGYFARASNKF